MNVRFLMPVGENLPGQVIEMKPEDAAWLLKSGRAVNADAADSSGVDLKGLTVHEMHEKNLKNVADENLATHAEMERLAGMGKPVAAGEPVLPTGGVTPPASVFPAMAEAQGIETTHPDALKAPKKAEEKKAEEAKPAQKPEVEKKK